MVGCEQLELHSGTVIDRRASVSVLVLVVIAMAALLVLALRSADRQVGVEWGLVEDMQVTARERLDAEGILGYHNVLEQQGRIDGFFRELIVNIALA